MTLTGAKTRHIAECLRRVGECLFFILLLQRCRGMGALGEFTRLYEALRPLPDRR